MFIALFTAGGVTGVVLANAGVDMLVHDTGLFLNSTPFLCSFIAFPKYASFSRVYLSQFLVGLIDGDGSLQVNHWKKKSLQFRAVIKLKYTYLNWLMLNHLSKTFQWGTVNITQTKRSFFVVWAIHDTKQLKELCLLLNIYPPLHAGRLLQFLFLKKYLFQDNYKYKKIQYYFWFRDFKYCNLNDIIACKSSQNLGKVPYFNAWLAGFIEAEGCFCIRENKNLSFSIGQKDCDYLILTIKDFFYIQNALRLLPSHFYLIECYKQKNLEAIILFLKTNPLLGQKYASFIIFENNLLQKNKTSE